MSKTLIQNYRKIANEIPKNVTLVAVSKTKPIALIETLYKEGQRIFGENRVEELVKKNKALPSDIKWHMIGHLQSKKVKKIASFISLIHSIDSLKLLTEVNKEAAKNNRIIDCLLQFHIAQEDSKYGFSQDEGLTVLKLVQKKDMKNVRVVGVMGMATFSEDQNLIKNEFKRLVEISNLTKVILPSATEISMGMSGDYKLAIEENSTMVRIGSTIFGSRT
jgi:pyridoxal phosphate enzyme (YggS family)